MISRTGIRSRLLAWVLLLALPIALAAAISLRVTERQFSEQIDRSVTNVAHVEASALQQALARYRRDADSLASADGLRRLMRRHVRDGTAAKSESTLEALARATSQRATENGSETVALRIVSPTGQVLGSSGETRWSSLDDALLARAMAESRTLFGDAFHTENEARVGVIAPILDTRDVALGALLLEMRLEPLTRSLDAHWRFGQTSEAYLVQSRADGKSEFISPLRFRRDATFRALAASDGATRERRSGSDDTVSSALDYRGELAVIASVKIRGTNWTLESKIDHDEVYSLFTRIRLVAAFSLAVTLGTLLLGWWLYLQPLARRLRHVSDAASEVVSGTYQARIDDRTRDEIGDIARSIDRLAHDMEQDIRLRTDAEERLRHQATHDALTGLANRKHANDRLTELDREETNATVSILFLDLDGFKGINDTHGHAIGDEILAEVSARVSAAMSACPSGLVARWGGDEFVVLLPGISLSEADDYVARVRALFERPFETSAGEQRLGCSIGRATTGAHHGALDTLHEADTRMYKDKAARRAQRADDPATLRRAG